MNETNPFASPEFSAPNDANTTLASTAPSGTKETKAKSNQGLFARVLGRAGRHKKGCECGKCEWSKKAENPFSSAPLPDAAIPDSESVPEFTPDNGQKFAFWGRLTARIVQAVFSLLTVDLPRKARAVFGDSRGADLVAGIEIKPEQLDRLEKSAAVVARKYNISTKYDEEFELCSDLASIFGPLFLTLRKLDKALAELPEAKEAN